MISHSKQESIETGITFINGCMNKRMNKWNLSEFLLRKRGIETLDQPTKYLTDPSPVLNRVFANIPFFINRTVDTEYYLGKDYPLFTDVEFSPELYTTKILQTFAYLISMDKSRFTRNSQTRDFVRFKMHNQRG